MSSSEVEMHPEERNVVTISNEDSQFYNTARCYYQVFVDEESLDLENKDYFFNVKLIKLTNTSLTIVAGTEYASADEVYEIREFNEAEIFLATPENQIWLSFIGKAQQ